MTVNLSIKNVPDSVAEALRARAEQNHRSLQGELMSILTQAVAARPERASAEPARNPRLSIDELAARAAKLFPSGTASSRDDIRAMRDGRYGEQWLENDRQDQPGKS